MIFISCYRNSCFGQNRQILTIIFYYFIRIVLNCEINTWWCTQMDMKLSSFLLLIVTIILTALIVIFNTGAATG